MDQTQGPKINLYSDPVYSLNSGLKLSEVFFSLLAVFFLEYGSTIVDAINSFYNENVMLSEEKLEIIKLKDDIRELSDERSKYNVKDDFAAYFKLDRKINTKQDAINKMEDALDQTKSFKKVFAMKLLGYFIRLVAFSFFSYMCSNATIFTVPKTDFPFISRILSSPNVFYDSSIYSENVAPVSILFLVTILFTSFDRIITFINGKKLLSRKKMESEDNASEVLAINFNQDVKALLIGHDRGFSIFDLTTVEKLDKAHENTGKFTNILHIERLFSSCLIAFVTQARPRNLIVYNFQKSINVCDPAFKSTIVAIKLNRLRLIVVLEDTILIHNVRDMKQLQQIKETPKNNSGIVDLSCAENSLLAYPGDSQKGIVNIYDAEHLTSAINIHAHDSPLAVIKFNADASKIATCSIKGTVIRIWQVSTGVKLYEFSRGMARNATIYSLAFSQCGVYLALSSNTETVHVFKCGIQELQQQQAVIGSPEGDSTYSGWINYYAKQASAYLPLQVNELMQREKSFATAGLPKFGYKNIVAIPTINKIPHLLVATIAGYLYCYRLPVEGGECSLLHQYTIGPERLTKEGSSSPAQTPVPSSPAATRAQNNSVEDEESLNDGGSN
uniref:Guided entry of tail-anchored proteins factor 1 n=1 Tax=Rhabditophanes sp. KR3021 TaxID=114890 RepID=A0AC35TNM8_9BILA